MNMKMKKNGKKIRTAHKTSRSGKKDFFWNYLMEHMDEIREETIGSQNDENSTSEPLWIMGLIRYTDLLYRILTMDADKPVNFEEWLNVDILTIAARLALDYGDNIEEAVKDLGASIVSIRFDLNSEEGCREVLEGYQTDPDGDCRCPRCGQYTKRFIRSAFLNAPVCLDCRAAEEEQKRNGQAPMSLTKWDLIAYLKENSRYAA